MKGETYLDTIELPPEDLFRRVLDFGLNASHATANNLIEGVVATYGPDVVIDGRWILDVIDRLEAAGFVYIDPVGIISFDLEQIKKTFHI